MKRKTVGSTAIGVGGGNDEESVSGGLAVIPTWTQARMISQPRAFFQRL